MNSDLIGTWMLLSYEAQTPDGSVALPLGTDPIGYLTYSADGRMSAAACSAAREPMGWQVGPGVDDKAAAYDSFIAYGGTWSTTGNEVTHHLELCSVPIMTGTDVRRNFQVDGDRLLITLSHLGDGSDRPQRLEWYRYKG